jgi:hypothetical protein
MSHDHDRRGGKDYEVGYGRPPQHTRFKPGQSGNAKGRPKGARNLATDLKEILGQTVRVTENGCPTRYTKQQLMLITALNKSIKGDPRATANILSLAAKAGLLAPEPDGADAPLSAQDKELIDLFIAMRTEGVSDDGQ